MRFEAITFASLCGSLEAEFKYRGAPEATKVALIAEHIRGVVDGASIAHGENGPADVSPQKLAMEIRRRVEPLFAITDEDGRELLISDEIDAMVSLNEIWRSVMGGYAAAPPRLLAIDEKASLLIGGGATRLMPKDVRRNIEQAGRARILTMSDSCDSALESMPEQTLQSWLGLPRESVKAWSTEFIDSLKLTRPLDGEVENLLVLNEQGWMPLAKFAGPFGYRLARRAVSFYGNPSFQYYLCTLKAVLNKLPAVEALARIERHDARRLQPLLVGSEGQRPTLQCDVSGAHCSVKVFWPLPEPESKLLYLGWRSLNSEHTNLWPRTYCFSSKLYPLLAGALEVLGYNVNIRTS
ncbi:hypothetical protein RI103_02425 [Paraburkholderia sp. FT54]|uniref:hypothetical protein n=1 Tax=Paraburkholderia sp. FT54 TaxID=3074437 RepID=UPI0028779C41|nr:hypothetical protein [Paraburkholderia sp. FT54]WNC90237.1 hypothetical protein RI103_02425 [Paraburkholderia sp. FT54]